jgi:hypothetical protein
VAKAIWTTGLAVQTVAVDGTLTMTVPMLNTGVRLGVMVLTLTADYVLRFDWRQDSGTLPIVSLAAAWSNV